MEHGREVLPGVARFTLANFLRRAFTDECAAAAAALGTEVDHVIAGLDDVEVVLDNQHGVAAVGELAQLLNVILGQMSFVGPRPEVPKYVELYTPYQRQVLLVRPGITDYASIAYRNENDLLAGAEDPEKMYIEQIMPDKIELNMKYLREISPLADIKLILKTVAAVVKG